MSATQRELCELHSGRMERLEDKLDTLIEQQAQIRVEIATLKSHTRLWSAAMSGIFTSVAAGLTALFKS